MRRWLLIVTAIVIVYFFDNLMPYYIYIEF